MVDSCVGVDDVRVNSPPDTPTASPDRSPLERRILSQVVRRFPNLEPTHLTRIIHKEGRYSFNQLI